MSYPTQPPFQRQSYRTGPITRADLERCAPPPDWTPDEEKTFRRAWSRPHISNPTSGTGALGTMPGGQAGWQAVARREAEAMTSAETWTAYFAAERAGTL